MESSGRELRMKDCQEAREVTVAQSKIRNGANSGSQEIL